MPGMTAEEILAKDFSHVKDQAGSKWREEAWCVGGCGCLSVLGVCVYEAVCFLCVIFEKKYKLLIICNILFQILPSITQLRKS